MSNRITLPEGRWCDPSRATSWNERQPLRRQQSCLARDGLAAGP